MLSGLSKTLLSSKLAYLRGWKAMERALVFLEMLQFRDAIIDSHRQRRKGG